MNDNSSFVFVFAWEPECLEATAPWQRGKSKVVLNNPTIDLILLIMECRFPGPSWPPYFALRPLQDPVALPPSTLPLGFLVR